MANTFELISAVTVSSPQASISFSSIPSTYTDILVSCSLRHSGAQVFATLSLNAGGSYSYRKIVGTGSGTPSSDSASDNLYQIWVDGNNQTASTFSSSQIYIPNYASTSTYKSISIESVTENNATGVYTGMSAALYSSNTAITSLTITPWATDTFVQYSTAYLYGVKNA
tara:strand:+ start:128 stop:634 length:507 start_codon:yes stop_codon:yes gene_type:complete